MALQEIAHTATTTAASRDGVRACWSIGSTWPTWSPTRLVRAARARGRDAGRRWGAQAFHHQRAKRAPSAVVTVQPNQEFSYTLLKGMPLRDYQATVTLTPVDGGTRSRTGAPPFAAKIPLTGPLYRISSGPASSAGVVAGLADHAAKAQGSAAA